MISIQLQMQLTIFNRWQTLFQTVYDIVLLERSAVSYRYLMQLKKVPDTHMHRPDIFKHYCRRNLHMAPILLLFSTTGIIIILIYRMKVNPIVEV